MEKSTLLFDIYGSCEKKFHLVGIIETIITINGNHKVNCILLWSFLKEKQEQNSESAMKSPGKLQAKRKMTSRIVYDEVALDALAAYTATTEYPGETVRDRNIRSRAYLDGFEAALICFKNAGLSQPRACVGSAVQH